LVLFDIALGVFGAALLVQSALLARAHRQRPQRDWSRGAWFGGAFIGIRAAVGVAALVGAAIGQELVSIVVIATGVALSTRVRVVWA
jgi:hypothetical protein